MNNEKKILEAGNTDETVKLPVYKRPSVIRLLCFLLAVLVLLNAALATIMIVRALPEKNGNNGAGDSSSLPSFSYKDANIRDYFAAFGADALTGHTIAGKEYKVDPVTDEYVREYVLSQMLGMATVSNGGKLNKTEAVDFADRVYLYILYVEKDGERIPINYFDSAYSMLNYVQIGAASFGKEFDEKLVGLVPAESGTAEFIKSGTIDADDVLVFSYTAEATVKDAEGNDKKLTETVNLERWDMTQIEEKFKTAILENCKAIGEEFTFELMSDLDEDGTEEKTTYKATVASVAKEENITKITATLPDDFFGASAEEEYTSLNGATLDFYLVIDYSIAFEISYETSVVEKVDGEDVKKTVKIELESVDDLTEKFIKEKIGHTFASAPVGDTQDVKDADARAKYLASVKEELAKSYDESVESNALALVWKYLCENVKFEKLPEAQVSEYAVYFLDSITSTYEYYAANDPSFALSFPTIEDFGPAYFNYDAKDYNTYGDFVNNSLAPNTVKQALLTYAIYNELGGLKANTAEYSRVQKEIIDREIAAAKESGETITEADILAHNDGETLHELVITEMVNDYLVSNNTIDWELSEDE